MPIEIVRSVSPERPQAARPPKPRIRASVACAHCRKRRIKCIIRESRAECDNCTAAQLECVVRDTDLRRRLANHVNSLWSSINSVRSIASRDTQDLQQRLEALERLVARDNRRISTGSDSTPSSERQDEVTSPSEDIAASNIHENGDSNLRVSLTNPISDEMSDVEYLSALPTSVHQTLLGNFWVHYNYVLQSVHRPSFDHGWQTHDPGTYSPFLHLCILGIGSRYSDVTDEEAAWFYPNSGRESVFHQRATRALKTVIEGEPYVCLIQGLLLYGDMEFAVGRYNNGCMHAGLACQLTVQTRIHLQPSAPLPPNEVQNRSMCVWACAMYDRYWALYLNRVSTFSIKNIGIRKPTDSYAPPENVNLLLPQKEIEVYDALIELMDLLGGFSAHEEVQSSSQDEHCYLMVAILHQQLLKWYSKLPNTLKWEPGNIRDATSSFLSLHQQYHYGVILLHRMFAFSNLPHGSLHEARLVRDEMDRLYSVPIRLCLDSALQIAEILTCHQQRYHPRTIFATSVQHANAAATVLSQAFESSHMHCPDQLTKYRRAYTVLTEYLRLNADTFDAASKMLAKLEAASLGPPLNSAFPLISPSPIATPGRYGRTSGMSPANSTMAIDSLLQAQPQSNTRHPGGVANLTPNWPNLGNVMYAHEIALLGVATPSGRL